MADDNFSELLEEFFADSDSEEEFAGYTKEDLRQFREVRDARRAEQEQNGSDIDDSDSSGSDMDESVRSGYDHAWLFVYFFSQETKSTTYYL